MCKVLHALSAMHLPRSVSALAAWVPAAEIRELMQVKGQGWR